VATSAPGSRRLSAPVSAAAGEDRPLVGKPRAGAWHPRLYAAELAGTALLVMAGVSAVIFMFGAGSPMPRLLPDPGVRRLVTGFLFGLSGTLVAVSPLGKVSGAHINPAVSIAFALEGKLAPRDAAGYVAAQLAGGCLAIPALRAWGATGASVLYGATVPDPAAGPVLAAAGEAGVTWALVTLIFMMSANRRTRRFTPWSIPFLFSFLVWLEAPLSGTSANPARTLGPNLLAAQLGVLWIYFLGPVTGALLAVGLVRLEPMTRHRPSIARVAHFHLDG